MKLTHTQLSVQEAMLCKIHNCGIEEARKRELSDGCLLLDSYSDDLLFGRTYFEGHGGKEFAMFNRTKEDIKAINRTDEWTIIGLPPTLSRVMYCLGHGYRYDYSNGMIMFMKNSIIDGIDRKLLNDDGTDCTLRDQSDETQTILGDILLSK